MISVIGGHLDFLEQMLLAWSTPLVGQHVLDRAHGRPAEHVHRRGRHGVQVGLSEVGHAMGHRQQQSGFQIHDGSAQRVVDAADETLAQRI